LGSRIPTDRQRVIRSVGRPGGCFPGTDAGNDDRLGPDSLSVLVLYLLGILSLIAIVQGS
jgi:hypothetical protein